jgi:hypothetical protein
VNKPLEWISRSRVRLAAAGRFQCPTSATHLDQLSASHHHLCSSCYHVDLHSSSLLRIDAHCDVVVSPHTDTHHSIVLLPVSSSYSQRISRESPIPFPSHLPSSWLGVHAEWRTWMADVARHRSSVGAAAPRWQFQPVSITSIRWD